MSAYNLTLQPSQYVRRGLLLVAGTPPFVMAFSPLSAVWLIVLLPALLLFYRQWWHSWHSVNQPALLTLNTDGKLYWFGGAVASGQLASGGLVSQYAVKLRWRRHTDQRVCQRWIFSDQCLPAQYSALARAITQQNWAAEDRR